mgnify:CR=1 FL=1
MQLFDDKRRQLAAEYQKEKKVNNRYSLVIKLLFLIIFFGFSFILFIILFVFLFFFFLVFFFFQAEDGIRDVR